MGTPAVVVRTRHADGTNVVTTEKDVDNTVQPLQVVMPREMKKAEAKAVTYWNGLKSKAKQTIESLSNMGMVLKAGKTSVKSNNQVFSKWRIKRFEGMTARFCSYAIQLHDNVDEIVKAFDDLGVENRLFTNPESVVNAWKRITKLPDDKTPPDGDDDTTPPDGDDDDTTPPSGASVTGEVVTLETLTPEKRIETLGESLNMVIETFNSGGLNEEQVKDIIKRLDATVKVLTDAD